MFCHITQHWRGKALISHEVIVNLISATTTQKGLKVRAQRDENRYEKGKVPSAQDLQSMRLTRHDFHGEWNYTIQPKPS